MSLSGTIKDMIGEQLKMLHVAFVAKVLNVSGKKAKIQPLGLIKDYGGTAKPQSAISGVAIAESALYKISEKNITYISDFDGSRKTQAVAVTTPISAGDIVICVCCDRNIDAALKGQNELPPVGFHNQSDCVIVAII